MSRAVYMPKGITTQISNGGSTSTYNTPGQIVLSGIMERQAPKLHTATHTREEREKRAQHAPPAATTHISLRLGRVRVGVEQRLYHRL